MRCRRCGRQCYRSHDEWICDVHGTQRDSYRPWDAIESTLDLRCGWCGDRVHRSVSAVNESTRRGRRVFCSSQCLARANRAG